MSTPESNEKSINNLKEEVVNGNEIFGGGKVTPIIIAMPDDQTPVDVIVPGVILPNNDRADYSNDGNVIPLGSTNTPENGWG